MTRIPAFALLAGAFFGALVSLQPIGDSDLFWHVEAGRRTLAGALPRADVFSWTVAGAPVFTDQWLGDVILAAARTIGDWRGVLALRVVAVAVLVAVIVATAMAARPGRPIVAVAAALPAIALSRFAWTDRPELLGLVCFAILVPLLRGGDRGLLVSIPLLAIWTQLHGSFAIGLALVLATCAARGLTERRDRWRFVPIASAAAVATLLGPSGVATWTSSGGHFLAPPRYIAEEGPPDTSSLAGVLFFVTLGLLLASALLSRRRATLEALAILLPVAFVSLTAARHMPLLAIAAAPFLAERLPDPLATWRERASRGGGARATVSARSGHAVVAAASAAALALAILIADGRVDETGYPRAALAALPSGPGLLNRYEWGGWLMYAAPRTPVFIDGRLFPYVPGVLDDYRAILNAHPGWEAVADRRGVRTMLVRPDDPIAGRAPDRGWRVAYRDDVALVLAR
ncbi:MAG TPA: hypothetical protein VFV20_04470 [Candidatus Limnocylindria bacterium]|nr:hypothetical protein [Candidatus Limnocylindria bacterium]